MKIYAPWLTAALIMLIIFSAIYAVVQQAQRNDANYPQIQIAQDAANALNQGAAPSSLATAKVDIKHSLAPFIIIYNQSGKVIAGTGYVNDSIPNVPYGVLSSSEGKTYNIVTWQPQKGVRIAAVSIAATHYFVLSGRSLEQIEKNETRTLQLVLLETTASLLVLLGGFLISRK